MNKEIFRKTHEIQGTIFRKNIAGIHVPGLSRKIEEALLTRVFLLYGASDNEARNLANHELDHAHGVPNRLQIISALIDENKQIAGAMCSFVADVTVMERFESAIAVGLSNMSRDDVDLVSWCIVHGTLDEAKQIVDRINSIS